MDGAHEKCHSIQYGSQQNSDFLTASGNVFWAVYYKITPYGRAYKFDPTAKAPKAVSSR